MPDSMIERIGNEAQPLVVIDDFAADPGALRDAALRASFAAADEHYPGIRAPLPPQYLATQLPIIARATGRAFDRVQRLRVVDAAFSIVTTPPGALTVAQRLPHVDAYGRERIALVHYLSLRGGDGTAFFRHRATGFETIDADRAPIYARHLAAQIAAAAPPHAYITADTDLFERHRLVEARYNRAMVYRSMALHSGAIAADAGLSDDPATGRLTVTAFLTIE